MNSRNLISIIVMKIREIKEADKKPFAEVKKDIK